MFQQKSFFENKKINSLNELRQTCFQFAKAFSPSQLILLEGPLSVGKSQMVRYMAEALGFPKEEVRSPTFSLINVYKKAGRLIYHTDFYRLKSAEEVEAIAFWDIFYEPAIVFIEWPHLVKKELPPLWRKLYIELSFCPPSDEGMDSKEGRNLKWAWSDSPKE